jgi:cobalt-precorrin 5A hydrolase
MAPCAACHAMDVGKVMIVAGVGCRRQVRASEVAAAIEMAMRQWSTYQLSIRQPSVSEGPDGETRRQLPDCIAVPASKADEAGILAAAETLAVPLVVVPQEALEAASARTLTRSARSLAEMNVHSVSEAAALAAAGIHSKLVVPRVTLANVTCALAESELQA